MNERALEEIVLKCLAETKPEVGDCPLDPERPFDEQFVFPPAERQALADALQEELGVDISPAMRGRLNSLSGWVDYLGRALNA